MPVLAIIGRETFGAVQAPFKITVTVMPDLINALQAYAELYREAYGQSETVAELIPYMLQAFLDGDRGFAKAVKKRGGTSSPSAIRKARPRSTDQSCADPMNHS